MKVGEGVVVVFGARELKVLAIRTFLGSGLRLAIADEATNPNLAWADIPIVLPDFKDEAAALAGTERRLGGEKVRAVVSLWDLFLPLAAALAQRYGVPGLSPDALQFLRNKHLMRRRLAEAGVPVPRFLEVVSWDEALAAARSLGYPLVLKPTDRAGSIGVTRVNGESELHQVFQEVRRWSRNGVLLAEEYMPGSEVSVECFAWQGRPQVVTVTDKLVTDGPYFVEMGHTLPSQLPPAVRDGAAAVAEAAVRALGVDSVVCHVEVRLTPDGPRVVEVNGRPAGDLIPELILRALGVNLYQVALDLALGRQPDARPSRGWGAAVRFLGGPPGYLREVSYPGSDRLPPEVVRLTLFVEPGRTLEPVVNNDVRRALVVAVAPDAARAAAEAERVRDEIRLEITPRDGVA